MSVKINAVLTEDTVPRGGRGKSPLSARIKAGALANAQRDLSIAEEWFPLRKTRGVSRKSPA